MATFKELTTEQNNTLRANWKALNDATLLLGDTDTEEARTKAENAWADFFALCDAYDADRMDSYWHYSVAA